MDPTPIQQAVDEILRIVYEAEKQGEYVENVTVEEIESKYEIPNILADRFMSERLLSVNNKSPFVLITDYGRRVQEEGGYIALLNRKEKQQEREDYLKELEISDKLGSIEDRKRNRVLAWIAIGVSIISLIVSIV